MEPEAGAQVGSDAELITRVRVGDTAAFGELYRRHVGAATALGRQVARGPAEADDLVSESFARVLDGLKSGGGPDAAFRAYLFTTLRHTAYDRTRKDSRLKFTDDMEAHETPVDAPDPVIAMAENGMVGKAFASLPERWQAVLWHTQVEGMSPAEVGVLLGMSANAVTSLAFRAREGLREAYLQAHLADTAQEQCRWTTDRLGAWARGGLSKREQTIGRRAPGELRSLRRPGRRAHGDQLQPAQRPRSSAARWAGSRISRGARAGRRADPGGGDVRHRFGGGYGLRRADDRGGRGRGRWCARGRRGELVQSTLGCGRDRDGSRRRGRHGRGDHRDFGRLVADEFCGCRGRHHRGLDRGRRRSWHRRVRGSAGTGANGSGANGSGANGSGADGTSASGTAASSTAANGTDDSNGNAPTDGAQGNQTGSSDQPSPTGQPGPTDQPGSGNGLPGDTTTSPDQVGPPTSDPNLIPVPLVPTTSTNAQGSTQQPTSGSPQQQQPSAPLTRTSSPTSAPAPTQVPTSLSTPRPTTRTTGPTTPTTRADLADHDFHHPDDRGLAERLDLGRSLFSAGRRVDRRSGRRRQQQRKRHVRRAARWSSALRASLSVRQRPVCAARTARGLRAGCRDRRLLGCRRGDELLTARSESGSSAPYLVHPHGRRSMRNPDRWSSAGEHSPRPSTSASSPESPGS